MGKRRRGDRVQRAKRTTDHVPLFPHRLSFLRPGRLAAPAKALRMGKRRRGDRVQRAKRTTDVRPPLPNKGSFLLPSSEATRGAPSHVVAWQRRPKPCAWASEGAEIVSNEQSEPPITSPSSHTGCRSSDLVAWQRRPKPCAWASEGAEIVSNEQSEPPTSVPPLPNKGSFLLPSSEATRGAPSHVVAWLAPAKALRMGKRRRGDRVQRAKRTTDHVPLFPHRLSFLPTRLHSPPARLRARQASLRAGRGVLFWSPGRGFHGWRAKRTTRVCSPANAGQRKNSCGASR